MTLPTNKLVFLEEWTRGTLRDPMQHFRKRSKRECPICGYRGNFISAWSRQETRCPNCSSKERDRIFQLYLNKTGISVDGKKILHFSPERPFWRLWHSMPGYVSGDVKKNKVANSFIDVTQIGYPDNDFDVVICNHVLEHVYNDRKGMSECYRVLKKGGVGFFSVPMSEVSHETFEPPPSMSRAEVEKICGWDHKRLYGHDFVDRLKDVGFSVEEITFTDEEAERHRLRSEAKNGKNYDRVFVAVK